MEKVRIQDDLYTYVNQETLDNLVIPEDMPVAGGFASLAKDVEKLMIDEFNAMCKEGKYPNSYLERACKLYTLAKDVKRKKKHGIKPALKNLAILNKVNTMRGLNLHAKDLALKGISTPISLMVEPDMKNTTRHCVYVQGPSVILPDATYYKEEMAAVCDNLYICTDDGSEGFKGLVTAMLEKLVNEDGKVYDQAVAIGPMIMMKFATLTCKKLGLPVIVSLNTLMVDGTGMCGACRVTVGG